MPFCCPLLKHLNLEEVSLDNVGFNNFMGSCLLLERSSLVSCVFKSFDEHSSEIIIRSTPFKVPTTMGMRTYGGLKCVISLPSLLKLSINTLMYHKIMQRAVLNALNFVVELHCANCCMQVISILCF